MINKGFIKILQTSKELLYFLENNENFELLAKYIDNDQIKRILYEYPTFLKKETINQIEPIEEIKNLEVEKSLLCLTFIKYEKNIKNYSILKKLKIYINSVNNKIIKILQN